MELVGSASKETDMGYLAGGLGAVLFYILQMVQLLVVASVIMSWVSADPGNPLVQAVYRMTEPLYRPVRKVTGKIPVPLDLAPIGVFLVIIFLQETVVKALRQMSLG